jgi:hypothetical protein
MPPDDDEGGDLGELRRDGATKSKGKGKWDEEMGEVEVMQESYPPVNSVEEDERRIQDVS